MTGSLPWIVSTALLGEAMPIGEGPNSDTWIVFGTVCTPWSTIGIVNVSLADADREVELALDRAEVIGIDRGAFGRPAGHAVAERDVADLGVLARVGALDRDHCLTGVFVHGQRGRHEPEAAGVK